jgi:hypothetical protein
VSVKQTAPANTLGGGRCLLCVESLARGRGGARVLGGTSLPGAWLGARLPRSAAPVPWLSPRTAGTCTAVRVLCPARHVALLSCSAASGHGIVHGMLWLHELHAHMHMLSTAVAYYRYMIRGTLE